MSSPAAGEVPRVQSPAEVDAATVLGVCASMKPAPGRAGRSAVRGLLGWGMAQLALRYPRVRLLDLRDHPLPLFDGRTPDEHDDPQVAFVRECVGRAGALLVAVPGYWCGVSGVFKNFVDVLCGPAYDLPSPRATVFTGRPAGVLVVGADAESTAAAAEQAQRILASAGARLAGPAATLANPRDEAVETDELQRALLLLAATLARAAHEGRDGG